MDSQYTPRKYADRCSGCGCVGFVIDYSTKASQICSQCHGKGHTPTLRPGLNPIVLVCNVCGYAASLCKCIKPEVRISL